MKKAKPQSELDLLIHAFPHDFCQTQGQVFVKMGVGRTPVPLSKIFAIFMFATSKSTFFKSLHKQKRYQINVTFWDAKFLRRAFFVKIVKGPGPVHFVKKARYVVNL
jgi:hypothetical protein